MANQTSLYDVHLAANARVIDFGGWDMPVNYGSQIEEHHSVRRDAGMFDVSHMTVIDLSGSGQREFLNRLLANDPGKLANPGKAMYSCMLNEQGGVIDDLIVYFFSQDWFRLVVNAATRDKDIAWISKQAAAFEVSVNERSDLAMIAVQGPNARSKAYSVLPETLQSAAMDIKPFNATTNGDWCIARTGYTGEDGFEIMLPDSAAVDLWNALAGAGVNPCGLGARDTLRLEAGMSLYGSEMDESTTPLESALGWTIGWEPADRDFIGRQALEAQKAAGVPRKLVGLVLEQRGVLRSHQKVVVDGVGEGETTSGSYSPTIERSIGLARVPADTGDSCHVDIRGKLLATRVVRPPFVRKGEICIED